MLGTGLLPVAASRGCSSLWCGLLTAVVSPVAEHGLTNCGPQAQLLHGVRISPYDIVSVYIIRHVTKLKKGVQDDWLGLNQRGFLRPRGKGTTAPS